MIDHPIMLSPCAGEPELKDPAVTGIFAEEMAEIAAGEHVYPWCGHIGRRDGAPVGFGGFKTPPDADGAVEIGYLTFPAHEGTGVAKAIAAAMVDIARSNGARRIVAHTLAEMNPSTSVLAANGFVRDGETIDPDEGLVWRWALDL